MESFYSWAIDSRSSEGHGLLGRYFFTRGAHIPPSSEGCRVALFKTRAIARQVLKEGYTPYIGDTWRPKVVRVKVTVIVI